MVSSAIHNQFASHIQSLPPPDAVSDHRDAQRVAWLATTVPNASRRLRSCLAAVVLLMAAVRLAEAVLFEHVFGADNGNSAPRLDASAATTTR